MVDGGLICSSVFDGKRIEWHMIVNLGGVLQPSTHV
jgi:hypothetical protein